MTPEVIDAKKKIRYLSTLSSLEYERQRENAAEDLGIRVSVLDREVSMAKPKEANENPFFDVILPWDDPNVPMTVEHGSL
jgi:hypothetical protein